MLIGFIGDTLKFWMNSFSSIFTAEFHAFCKAHEAVDNLLPGKFLPYWKSVLPKHNARSTDSWFYLPTLVAMHDLHCNHNFRVTLAWIPGHVFICGNKAVGALTRDATVEGTLVPCVLRVPCVDESWRNGNKSGAMPWASGYEMWNQWYTHGGHLLALLLWHGCGDLPEGWPRPSDT
jgi:hypothetical protein